MANWSEIFEEVQKTSSGPQKDIDGVRWKYLTKLFELTGRNVVAFYSGWLQKQGLKSPHFVISDNAMPGLMTAVNKLDKSKGLDLILHTPGGEINATEQIVFYLRKIFRNNIRAIVPQLAMSAGMMIALASNSIVMGLHSNLGPIDPQVGGGPARAILEEFKEIKRLYGSSPKEAEAWVPILQKYSPTLIGACEKAIKLSETMVASWLASGMFEEAEDRDKQAEKIVAALGSHAQTLSHGRHITIEQARQLGLKVEALEDDAALQDAVLSVHHCYTVTFSQTACVSIIENHLGKRFINAQMIAQPGLPMMVNPPPA
jgi:Serine dehydrogenase proteinase